MAPKTLFARAAVAMAMVVAIALAGAAHAQTSARSRSLADQVNLSQASKKTLLVFPFDVPTTVPGDADVSILLTDVARSRLIASDMYTVVAFYKSLAPVARLHNDQVLSDADIMKPFAEDNAKAIKVTKAVGYDLAFIGAVNDYSYNDADKQASITITGILIDVATGKLLKNEVLSATSAKGGSAKEPQKAQEAARAAGDKLMTKVVPAIQVVKTVPPTQPMKNTPPPKPNGKKRNNSGVLLGLLAVALGLGIGLSSGSGGGGGGLDLPPSPPH